MSASQLSWRYLYRASAKSGYIIDDRQRLQSYLPSRLMVNKGECPFLLLSPQKQTMCGPLHVEPFQGEVHSFRSTLMAFCFGRFHPLLAHVCLPPRWFCRAVLSLVPRNRSLETILQFFFDTSNPRHLDHWQRGHGPHGFQKSALLEEPT